MAKLCAVNIPVARVNPKRVCEFAKATGRFAKTGQPDARNLSQYGEAIQPMTTPLPSEQEQELVSLLSRRCQLIEMRVMEQNRLKTAGKTMQPRIEKHLTWHN